MLEQQSQRITAFENTFDIFRSEMTRWMKDFQDSLNMKADLETVKSLENSLLDRLNEIVKALTK